MKILMVNKFLYPNGGSETYITKLGQYFQSQNHQVEYFGMEDKRNIVGNKGQIYTSNMDFHTNKFQKILYPIQIIYSTEARKKIGKVIEKLKPDVVHLNNINFQLTPSIIDEVKKRQIPIVWTAHDYQLICPNHMLYNQKESKPCERCFGGRYINCVKHACIHNSKLKSLLGMTEAYVYAMRKTYKKVDRVICPSNFLEKKLLTNSIFTGKTVVMHNFIEPVKWEEKQKKEDYILYFGRYSQEKGIETLIKVCRQLPQLPFVFAGNGPLEDKIKTVKNIKNIGFQSGKRLERVIRKAQFSVYPSEWYENCPFSVMESQMFQTPVLGADIGGIPELIDVFQTGELFQSGNSDELKQRIEALWKDKKRLKQYSENCKQIKFDTVKEYGEKLIKIYQSIGA